MRVRTEKPKNAPLTPTTNLNHTHTQNPPLPLQVAPPIYLIKKQMMEESDTNQQDLEEEVHYSGILEEVGVRAQ